MLPPEKDRKRKDETMGMKQIYDKSNPTVIANTQAAHKAFSEAIEAAREELGMTKYELGNSADASPAQTHRVLTDPDANLTLATMQRFAAPVGKKVVLQVVDIDEEAEEEL